MKKIVILLLLSVVTINIKAQNKPVAMKRDSKIESVTIFTSGAQITRSSEIRADKGVYELQFNNLSPYISEKTIQFKADNSIEIVSVKLNQNVNIVNPAQADTVKALQTKIKNIDRDIIINQIEQQTINSQIKFLNDNSAIGGKTNELSLSNLKQTADYYFASMRELRLKFNDISNKVTELEKQKTEANNELEKIEENLDRTMSQIVVTIDKKTNAATPLELSYYTPRAGWAPIYDIRATDTSSPIEISYKAQIVQNTMEDWANVQLTLSNSNPNISGEAPKLEPWYRNAYKIQESSKSMNSASYESVALDEVVAVGYGTEKDIRIRGAGSMAKVAPEPRIMANENGTSFEFRIRTPYSIPSSSKATTVDINRTPVDATFNYVVVPSVKKDVFLVANITNWEKLNLLSGVANIYFSNTFVGNTRINTQELSDTLTVSLGIDPQIVVERKTIEQYNSKRTIGSKQEQSYGWSISARNTKPNPIKLTIIDQVPLTGSSALEVTIDNISGAQYDSKTGEVKWLLDIPANSKNEVELRYKLRFPKDYRLY